MTQQEKMKLLEDIEKLPEKDRRFIQGWVAATVAKAEHKAENVSEDANTEVA